MTTLAARPLAVEVEAIRAAATSAIETEIYETEIATEIETSEISAMARPRSAATWTAIGAAATEISTPENRESALAVVAPVRLRHHPVIFVI